MKEDLPGGHDSSAGTRIKSVEVIRKDNDLPERFDDGVQLLRDLNLGGGARTLEFVPRMPTMDFVPTEREEQNSRDGNAEQDFVSHGALWPDLMVSLLNACRAEPRSPLSEAVPSFVRPSSGGDNITPTALM